MNPDISTSPSPWIEVKIPQEKGGETNETQNLYNN